MQWDFKHSSLIPRYNYFLTNMRCYRKYKYRAMLAKANKGVAKELDLIKFI